MWLFIEGLYILLVLCHFNKHILHVNKHNRGKKVAGLNPVQMGSSCVESACSPCVFSRCSGFISHHMQIRGCVNWRLHTSCCCFSLWILRTQLSVRPHTLSSSHSAPQRCPPPSVERRRHQCFQRLTSSAVSQWCSTSSRKSSRDFSPVQRWSSFLSASCSRVGMNTLRAKCVSSACQSAEWTPERWIYCCDRWRHVSLCEHVHIKGAGFTAYDQSQTWTVWLTAEPHISQQGSNCSTIKIRGEQTHDPE